MINYPQLPGVTTKRSQSTTKGSRLSTLAELFPNPALAEVLALFLLHPESEFYQRGIAESTVNVLRQVQRALKRIERAGLVTKTRRGNTATWFIIKPSECILPLRI